MFSGPHEEEEGTQHGSHQVRGEVQDRQEQMVLPEAEILNPNVVLKLLSVIIKELSVTIYCFQIKSLGKND